MMFFGAVILSLACASVRSQDDCDNRIDCEAYGSGICGGAYQKFARDNCARFCGFCGEQRPLPTRTPVTEYPGQCADRLSYCNDYDRDICYGQYAETAKYHCKRFCGYCGGRPEPTSPPVGCHDRSQLCHYYGPSVCYQQYGIDNCAHYCGNCNNPVPRGCFYNGQTRRIGETWTEGCDLRCSCSYNLGVYVTRCKQRCPVWHLPSSCYLQPPAPGRCCQTPVCPPWYKINYPADYDPNDN